MARNYNLGLVNLIVHAVPNMCCFLCLEIFSGSHCLISWSNQVFVFFFSFEVQALVSQHSRPFKNLVYCISRLSCQPLSHTLLFSQKKTNSQTNKKPIFIYMHIFFPKCFYTCFFFCLLQRLCHSFLCVSKCCPSKHWTEFSWRSIYFLVHKGYIGSLLNSLKCSFNNVFL